MHYSKIILILTTLSWIVACSPSAPPVESTFRLAWEGMPRTIDPRYSNDADSQYLKDIIHCYLIGFDADGKIKNYLASDFKWINGKTLEVGLNPNYKFWDQQPVTAEDVKATYEFFKTTSSDPSPLKYAFENLNSIEVVRPDRLRFNLKEPDGEFPYNLGIGILPQKLALGMRIVDAKKMMGCGVFKVDHQNVSYLQLARVNEPKGAKEAKEAREVVTVKRSGQNSIQNPQNKDVQFIRIEFVKDENTRLYKLRNSELDLVQNGLNRDQLMQIDQYKNLRILRKSGLNTSYMAFQFEDPILKIKKVRQAIAYAINREKIMEHIFHGWATAATTILTPSDPYFNRKLKPTLYDPAYSKRLLDEAGFPLSEGKDGGRAKHRLSLKVRTTTNTTRLLIAHAIADDLAQVGVNLQVESMDWGKFKDDVDRGVAQMWNLGWVGFKGPSIYKYAFSTQSFPPNGANRGRFSHPQLDRLLAQAGSETEFKKRQSLYDEVQKIVLAELPYVFLWHEDLFAVLNERVTGYEIRADGGIDSIMNVTFKRK